jgi:hypothetical protein
MQRGPLLQPFTQQNCSVRPASRSQARRAQPLPARASHTASASSASFCLTCPDPPKEENPFSERVFLLRLLRETLHSFLRGKPRYAPLSPRPVASLRGLTPFPQSCHGFVLAPSSLQKPRQPRVLVKSSGGWGSLQQQARRQSGAGIPVLPNAAGSATSRGGNAHRPSDLPPMLLLRARRFRSPPREFPRRRICSDLYS